MSAPASATPVTIAEFLEKPVNNDDWYELTGEIISIVSNNAYGNFTIRDNTGSVYIYGMVQAWAGGKNDQSFNKIGLKVGDTVTLWSLRDEYNGQPQGGGNDIPAIYKSHVEGEPVEPEPLPAESPLWDLDQMLITPHVAGNFFLSETFERIVRIAGENLKAWANHEPFRNVVDLKAGY